MVNAAETQIATSSAHEHVHGPDCKHDHAGESGSGEYQDRFLDGGNRIIAYDLLQAREKVNETDDPDAKRYFEAKELYRKGYELAMSIPPVLEGDVLDKHEEDIKTAAEDMVAAWVMDDKAAPMSERVLILGQQFEKVLLKNIPEEQQEGFFVKDSLLFSAWILLVGKQYDHCITTLTLALDTYNDLPVRMYFVRATCHLSNGDLDAGIADLKLCIEKEPTYPYPYSVLGSIYISNKNKEEAIKNFKLYLENGHADTADYTNSLYGLAFLTLDNKSEAAEYYEKGKKNEERFKDLYGSVPGLNDIKRRAILAHEPADKAKKMIAAAMPPVQPNAKIERLIEAGILGRPKSYPPSPEQCSECGSKHRQGEPGKSLLSCGACQSIWYCSRDCQKANYRKGHKAACASLKKAITA
ncbi:hypothetical protein INT43_001282 [Umbelopsis isabellina]|uniref:MYND-type domain-containing protein n=1 Tax=Mortierella isabellina TaxID=91625 RepID=A0A8H7PL04_MORIS|nr:hypothetical protein INT43_001282 [Umbelopsis isabellina]